MRKLFWFKPGYLIFIKKSTVFVCFISVERMFIKSMIEGVLLIRGNKVCFRKTACVGVSPR